jgi:hypothetical protein
MEPNVDRRLINNGVQPGSPRGWFTTLLSLPQCHSAFGTIPSTLVWVDQSQVSWRVVLTLYRVFPPNFTTSHMTQGTDCQHVSGVTPLGHTPYTWYHPNITLKYGRGSGFMERKYHVSPQKQVMTASFLSLETMQCSRNDQQYALIVPLLYSIYWLLHVLAVACHHQGAS